LNLCGVMLEEVPQHQLQCQGVPMIAAPVGGGDIIGDDPLEPGYAVGAMDQVVATIIGRCSCSAMAAISSSVSSERATQSSNVSIGEPPCQSDISSAMPMVRLDLHQPRTRRDRIVLI
jgi:hypothetical protein